MAIELEQQEFESQPASQQSVSNGKPGAVDAHPDPDTSNGDDLFPHQPDMIGPEEGIVGGRVKIDVTKMSPCRYKVGATDIEHGRSLVAEIADLSRSGSREKIAKKIVQGLDLSKEAEAILVDAIDNALLQKTEPNAEHDTSSDGESRRYVVDEDDEDLTKQGIYLETPVGRMQLTNFVLDINEDRIVSDTDAEGSSRLYRGTIKCLGQVSPFEITPEQFVDKLETSVHNAAGPKVKFLARPAQVRAAISSTISPVQRHATTSCGWTEDRSRFVVPGGWVDAYGYHQNGENHDGLEVDLSHQERARWLGFMSLDAEQLKQVKAHLTSDFVSLHDRNIMLTMLGLVALAPMLQFVGVSSRPLIWLQGLTGAGKSFIARFTMNFFGDFDSPAGERYISWKSTGNYLQTAGFFFRDMLYLVDDFKPEDCKHSDVVKVVQCFADGAARSRLRADSTMHATQPIRGLLFTTGEDFPESNASGMARSIVIRVPQHAKDFDVADRCQQKRSLYRRFTAALIADVICYRRWDGFRARVEHWRSYYNNRIAGRPNDARIAGNHACLAAAVELVCNFLSDAWPEAADVARNYNEQYLMSLVIDSAGEVEGETTASIFLDTLDTLLHFGRVHIQDLTLEEASETKSRDMENVVGRLLSPSSYTYTRRANLPTEPDAVIGLSMSLSLERVQESLRAQAKQPLKVSERTLLDQLAADGLLVDGDNRLINGDTRGDRTKKGRLGGRSVNLALIRAEAFPSLLSHPGSENADFAQSTLDLGRADSPSHSQSVIQFNQPHTKAR